MAEDNTLPPEDVEALRIVLTALKDGKLADALAAVAQRPTILSHDGGFDNAPLLIQILKGENMSREQLKQQLTDKEKIAAALGTSAEQTPDKFIADMLSLYDDLDGCTFAEFQAAGAAADAAAKPAAATPGEEAVPVVSETKEDIPVVEEDPGTKDLDDEENPEGIIIKPKNNGKERDENPEPAPSTDLEVWLDKLARDAVEASGHIPHEGIYIHAIAGKPGDGATAIGDAIEAVREVFPKSMMLKCPEGMSEEEFNKKRSTMSTGDISDEDYWKYLLDKNWVHLAQDADTKKYSLHIYNPCPGADIQEHNNHLEGKGFAKDEASDEIYCGYAFKYGCTAVGLNNAHFNKIKLTDDGEEQNLFKSIHGMGIQDGVFHVFTNKNDNSDAVQISENMISAPNSSDANILTIIGAAHGMDTEEYTIEAKGDALIKTAKAFQANGLALDDETWTAVLAAVNKGQKDDAQLKNIDQVKAHLSKPVATPSRPAPGAGTGTGAETPPEPTG